MQKKHLIYLLFSCVLVACSNYNEVIKGDDYVKKFELANSLYDDEDFLKSIVLETYYAHLSKLLAFSGQKIKSGEVLGLGGNTGHSFGSHLHFEVRFYDDSIYL